MILVSACLIGIACRYNGTSKRNDRVLEFLKGKSFVPVCPESLSGLAVPRPPAEIEGHDGTRVITGKTRVLLSSGTDVTAAFMRGANESLKWARLVDADRAILKERSPSCGVHQIYHDGRLVDGVGVFTALLMREKIPIISEREIPQED